MKQENIDVTNVFLEYTLSAVEQTIFLNQQAMWCAGYTISFTACHA